MEGEGEKGIERRLIDDVNISRFTTTGSRVEWCRNQTST